ncbi:MAG: DNA-binding protein [Staphylococcus warneri]|nr:DNA-binding protein [Staphylococcus warneri]
MSENLKTIKELADELGVSKQNLQYHVKFLPTKKRQKNESGIVVLNIEEQMFISGRIKKNKAKDINDETKKGQKNINDETKKRQKNNDVFAFNNHLLKEIIDLKEVNKQLLESQKQTQNLLDQQQRLALLDNKLLEEYKAEINDLKALKMPSQETKEEQANIQPQEELETLKEQTRALNDKIKGQEELNNQSSKKWYQFWK